MGTEIYYFTGTGNSLFVARELKKLLPDAELIPIVKAIKDSSFTTKAENIGFVFPCHGLTIPIPVRIFIRRMDVASSNYFFAVATRGGTVFRGFSIIKKYLKRQGKCLNAGFIINMGLNDPKLGFFSVPTQDELDRLESNALKKLKEIQRIILGQDNYRCDKNDGVNFTQNPILNFVLEKLIIFMTHFISPMVKKYFYSDSKCTGCGTCEKLCPANKIKINGDKPVWQRNIDCYLCYACLNYCPSEAVQIYSKTWIKSYTIEKGRYQHPCATVKDISEQKN